MTGPDTEFISFVKATTLAGQAADRPPASASLPSQLPVIGLSDIVIFPGSVSPLLVDSAASVQLVDDAVAGDRLVCLVLQKRAEVSDPGPEDLFRVGCAARVLKLLKFPDETARILVEGLQRVRLTDFPQQAPYVRADIETMPEPPDESLETTALARTVSQCFREVVKLSPALADHVKLASLNTFEPVRLADLVAGNLNLSLEEKQRLLESPGVHDRLQALMPLITREIELASLGTKIQNEVSSALSKNQRDYFLREQLRAIQRELGEADPAQAEITQLRRQVEEESLPEEVRAVVLREVERLTYIPAAVAEHTVIRNYVDWLLHLPWTQTTPDKIDLVEARRLLDREHYGLAKVKERLIEFLAVIKLKPDSPAPILCLVGPPGVGKTSLGRSLAEAMGRKFARISLGGMRDEAEIRGHRRTYVGALPGRLLQALRRCGSRNPVILLDEMDKIGADFRGDPASALLEVLDPEQNTTFTDHYLELPFDLSRVLFLATANWLDPVHAALRDRLEVLEIPGYTDAEKLHIARVHLLPRTLESHGLTPANLEVGEDAVRALIHDYTREAGLRQLGRDLAALVRKTAGRIATGHGSAQVVIRSEDLAGQLGAARYRRETADESTAQPGVAIGLAWSPAGGDILHIESTKMPGSGKLLLTGSLGEVMKESAQAALSYLRSHAVELKLDLGPADHTDIHLHFPAGATPKDGPSAGLAMVAALASLMAGRALRPGYALTGEISLRGRVLPVGGIKEKVLAAARCGLTHVVLPADNRKDWDEIPAEARAGVEPFFVAGVSGALRRLLPRT
ncbi:MAG: endopeptidase La [Limisphaerales bacterium]